MAPPADDPPPGVPEWVVTYGDMMSLLLTFFIMLVSMSELKQDGKHRAMLDSIRQTFGPTLGEAGVPGPSFQSNSDNPAMSSRGRRSEGGTKKSSQDSKGRAGAHKTVRRISHGTVVTIGGPALFQRFDATLSVALREELDILVDVLLTKPNRFIVRGHASPEPLPPDSIYRDQLELSFARAHNVSQYFIEKGIDSRRVLCSAVGDTEPRILTREQKLQNRNRRVDVFLIDSYISRSSSTDSVTTGR